MNRGILTEWMRACMSLLLLALSACASMDGWDTERAPAEFVEGERLLAEVTWIYPREQALSDAGWVKGWQRKLDAAGYGDEAIEDGSTAVLWSYCYGHNSGVPLCRHTGHYVARVPEALRGTLRADPPSNADPDANGDLVEVKLSRTPDGELVGEVVQVYRKSDEWGSCRVARLEGLSAVYALSMVGPPRAIWLECDDLEQAGWRRRPVRGAPFYEGPPVSEWIRVP